MNLDKEIVFSYLEEDNTQRAYFRVKPLLTLSGFVQEEAIRLWPDEGGLRIVPDKNEQGYFKDRMRNLGSFCLLDLTPFPAEANKIRTNKNYRPEKDECNQYILFSDAVHALPEHTFYEVIAGTPDQCAAMAQASTTPLFFIRDGETLYGPVRQSAPETPAPAPEMEATLYDLPCPDGKVRAILCIAQALHAAPAEPAQPAETEAKSTPAPEAPTVQEASEHQPEAAAPVSDTPAEYSPSSPEQCDALPIGQPLTILDQSKSFDETLRDINAELPSTANLLRDFSPETKPAPLPRLDLTGTPLYRGAPVRTSVPRPKNKMQEVVASQLRNAKNDPPAEPLPPNAKMTPVVNPVEAACIHMEAAWQLQESQQQLADFVLSLPGMAKYALPIAGSTALQNAMQQKLNDLEADRLAILYQLDKAHADLETFRKNSVAQAQEKAKKSLAELEEKQTACNDAVEAIKVQLDGLTLQRAALQKEIAALQNETLPKALSEALARTQLTAPVHGMPLYLNGRCGRSADIRTLLERMRKAAPMLDDATLTALLALIIACPRFMVVTPTIAPGMTLLQNIAASLGWADGFACQTNPDQQPVAQPAPQDSTPLLVVSTLQASFPIKDATRVMLTPGSANLAASTPYQLDSWPVLSLGALPFIAQFDAADEPLALNMLAHSADESAGDAIAALKPVMDLLQPLSGSAGAQLQRFVNICAASMPGGFATACDWAIRLWLLPSIQKGDERFKPLLEEYPMSQSLL